MSNQKPAELDFVKLVADAWDGRGRNTLTAGEQRALWCLAYLEQSRLEGGIPEWGQLNANERQRIVQAMRSAISLGRVCQLLLS